MDRVGMQSGKTCLFFCAFAAESGPVYWAAGVQVLTEPVRLNVLEESVSLNHPKVPRVSWSLRGSLLLPNLRLAEEPSAP